MYQFPSLPFMLHSPSTFFLMKGPRTTALRLFVQPQWRWSGWAVFYQFLQLMEHQWNEIDRVKPTTRKKNLSQCHFVHHKSHMDLTWDRTPGLRGERPATNRLSHGTAFPVHFILLKLITLIFGEMFKSRSSALCTFLQPSVHCKVSYFQNAGLNA
jgi:hypothetical protein